jgi:transcriptional/translational regulatory protein YebC/TACO1
MFDQVGYFKIKPEGIDRDELELELIDDGLDNLLDGHDDKGNPVLLLRCARDDFGNLQAGLDRRSIDAVESGIEWVPQTTTELGDDDVDEVMKLIERLEEDDDVQRVYHNLE